MEYLFANLGSLLLGTLVVLYLLMVVPVLAGLWRLHQKGGYRGVGAWLPVYNAWVWLRMGRLSGWWLPVLLVPGVGWPLWWVLSRRLALAFGKGWGTTLGMGLLPVLFLPWLGLSKAKYLLHAPNALSGATTVATPDETATTDVDQSAAAAPDDVQTRPQE